VSSSTSEKTLNLVVFKKTYFPVSKADLKVLIEHGVSSPKIDATVLDLLKSTLLRGVKISSITWAEAYQKLVEEFKASLLQHDCKFLQEDNWIIVSAPRKGSTPEIKKEKEKIYVASLEARVSLFQKYCGRYGFKVFTQYKSKEDFHLTRLSIMYDRESITFLNYGSYDTPEEPLELDFFLTPSCKLRLAKASNHSGIPALRVTFEDKFGEGFSESFTRAFNLSQIRKKDCLAAISFFSTLLTISKPDK
jgi:hypothetical protein